MSPSNDEEDLENMLLPEVLSMLAVSDSSQIGIYVERKGGVYEFLGVNSAGEIEHDQLTSQEYSARLRELVVSLSTERKKPNSRSFCGEREEEERGKR